MPEVKVRNQARTNKKQGRIYNHKSGRYHYKQGRNEIHHRIRRLLKKQNGNEDYYSPSLELSPVLRLDYENQVDKMLKRWGGEGAQFRGLQFRKLGRMDKIRLNQNQKQRQNEEEAIEIRNKTAFLKRVFSRLDNKYRKWILSLGLLYIQKCKKASRQITLPTFVTIPYW